MADLPDGVHRLVEMLEQRFGKIWADILLLCVVGGAAAWGLNTFMVLFVIPVFNIVINIWNALSAIKLSVPHNIEKTTESVTLVLMGLVITASMYVIFKERRKYDADMAAIAEAVTIQTKKVEEQARRVNDNTKLLAETSPIIEETIESYKKREAYLVGVVNDLIDKLNNAKIDGS